MGGESGQYGMPCSADYYFAFFGHTIQFSPAKGFLMCAMIIGDIGLTIGVCLWLSWGEQSYS
jgi:hypothetical protein